MNVKLGKELKEMLSKTFCRITRTLCAGTVLATGMLAANPAYAQAAEAQDSDAVDEVRSATTDRRQESEIIVTATKQVGGTRVQDTPIAVTAFGADQLDKLEFRGLATLNNSIPNADIGTSSSIPGNATLSMRGLGTNTNIASVEPTVGMFVDGVYLGVFFGSIFDTFDTEGIEVLRGPQGILFGKNVTGGAVLMRTTTPRNELYVNANASIETGPNYTGSATVSGPIIKDKLQIKIAGYVNHDEGWFYDEAQREKLGGGTTWIGRAALRFTPTEDIELIGRYEHGNADFDTDPAQQNIELYGGTHKVETSGLGFTRGEWDSFTVEANWDVGIGTITNIAGWRGVETGASFDIDSTRLDLYQSPYALTQNQFSDELRFAASFGDFDIVTGLYYFNSYMEMAYSRHLGTADEGFTRFLSGGGTQKQHTYGIFGSVDWHLSDTFTLNVGGRYTREKKRVQVATLAENGCDYDTIYTGLTCNFDFRDSNVSKAFTPKVGVQWKPDGDTMVYASWSKGLRGGGYSFRATTAGIPPGPYDDEIQYALEAGVKTDLADGAVRLNLALFRSKIHQLQRDVLVVDPLVGAGNVPDNVGNATYQGVEAEATVHLTDELTLNGFLGLLDAHYDSLTKDLNGDGVVDDVDLRLDIVRAAPFTWGVGATYETPVSDNADLFARASYSYKDRQAYLDNNSAYLLPQKLLDASIGVTLNDRVTLSIYGKNLTNEIITNAAVSLPAVYAGGYYTLQKGRVVGASVRFKM